VSHVPLGSIFGGGAGNSLLTFLQHQDFLEIDLILPLFIGHVLKWPEIIVQARNQKPSSVRKIFFLPLPFDLCFEGAPSSYRAINAYFVNKLIAYIFLPVMKKLLQNKNYRFVYLNSLVLHDLIRSSEKKCVLHIREVVDYKYARYPKVIKNLEQAAGLIFIDYRTYKAYDKDSAKAPLPCHRIINNPFDMHLARKWHKEKRKIIAELNLTPVSEKIFVYIGNIHPIKGVDFIIKAFVYAAPPNSKLIIVGTGNNQYLEFCSSLSKKENVIFMGMLKFANMQKIYAMADYVLRGDPDFRIGRTTFEALYAGGSVIIPGCEEDLKNEPDLLPFRSRIFFYNPQDIDSLSKVINEASLLDINIKSQEMPSGNIDKHCEEMKNFIQTCLLIKTP